MSVHQLRLIVTTVDYDEARRFYRDVLGLDELGAFSSEGGSLNSRLEAPAGLQLTLFEEPGGAERIVA